MIKFPSALSMPPPSSTSTNNKEVSGGNKVIARLAGSATAGACELMLFHPFDTVTKRLMSNTTKYVVPGQTLHNLNLVIFKHAADHSVFRKAISLFPGLGFAAGYKILQRMYKFGGQPFVNDALNKNCGVWFKQQFGEKQGKTLMHAAAGSVIGIGEVLLLPLDVLKIKAQTNPAAFGNHKGFGALKLMWNEGRRSLYAGGTWTAARNAPGSFALFGGAEFMYQNVFHMSDRKNATLPQFFAASVAGSVSSILVSSPLDTIKTRIQNKNFGDTTGGWTIVRTLLRDEGATALFKGLTPKILMVAPKLIFSFTLAQYLITKIEAALI